MRIRLLEVAHARAGDKGDTSMVTLFPYDDSTFPWLRGEVTAERVRNLFCQLVGNVVRYEVPSLTALHFVMTDALGGGVASSLALDPHGKSRSYLLLSMELELPYELRHGIRITLSGDRVKDNSH